MNAVTDTKIDRPVWPPSVAAASTKSASTPYVRPVYSWNRAMTSAGTPGLASPRVTAVDRMAKTAEPKPAVTTATGMTNRASEASRSGSGGSGRAQRVRKKAGRR